MNKFEVLGSIGEGAYGIVLKCRDKKSKKVHAVKKFKDKDTENLSIKKVLLRELRSLRQLKHPNIIELQGSFKQNERLYLVFEYIKTSLLDLQEAEPEGLRLGVVRKIAEGVLRGLAHMHASGLLHRDVKPENILVDGDNRPKIIDFGFCRPFSIDNEPLTNYVATRWYRSPELLVSEEYGPEVDMWALGCVIGEMIDGQPLFPGDDFLDQLYRIYESLGPLPEHLKDKIERNEQLCGVTLDMYFEQPENFDTEFIRNRYYDTVQDDNLIDLICRLLDMDGRKRITAAEALKHPFFDRQVSSSRGTNRNSTTERNTGDRVLFETDSMRGSVTLNKIDINMETAVEQKLPKFSVFRNEKTEHKENRGTLLPAIKTITIGKSSFKGTLLKPLGKTAKSVYGNTLLNRFK